MDRPLTPGQDYVGLTIDEVDVANRLAHCYDKTGAPLIASFREAPGAVLHIPAKGQRWTAKRQGWSWHLEARIDSAAEHEWVVTNLEPGDVRVGGDGTLWVTGDSAFLNENPLGTAIKDSFWKGSSWTTVTLSANPVSLDSIMPFLNGLLVAPELWTINGRVITFVNTMAAGGLVISYQTWDLILDDAAVVTAKAVISGAESFTP